MKFDELVVGLCRKLSRAFPDEFRQDYGAMIDGDAEEAIRAEFHRGGTWRLLLLIPRMLFDLGARVVAEHLAEFAQDTRYAMRVLARSPWFTLAAVLCLSIGIGGSAAMYAQIRATIFQATPGVSEPDSVIRVRQSLSYGMFEDLRDAKEPFASVSAYHGPAPLLVSRERAHPRGVACGRGTEPSFGNDGWRWHCGREGRVHRWRGVRAGDSQLSCGRGLLSGRRNPDRGRTGLSAGRPTGGFADIDRKPDPGQ